jgi:crotonobetainyl-CoA hydratase
MTSTVAAPVLVELRSRILVVTLNRPEAHNAINLEVSSLIGDALERAEHDPDVWALVLTGAGDKAFCAGADLKAVSRGEPVMSDEPVRRRRGFAQYVSHPISKPTVAAVNGFALGGGTEITLASDLAVAADVAQFGLPEVKRGIIAGAGGAFRLGRQIPRKVAMEVMLTGEPISAQRALELGLVNRVVAQAEVLDAALELAERICANAPLSVQATKRIALGVVDGGVPDEDADWEHTEKEARAVMSSRDAVEGPRAFAEKRHPVWEAR